MDRIVVTGNYSDSPGALDMGQLLGVSVDVSDLVSLKSFANSEFCPRFIPPSRSRRKVGKGLIGRTVIICSTSHSTLSRNELAMRNFVIARAAKENGAARVILEEPDLFYSAQDRGPARYGPMEVVRDDDDLKKFDGQPFTALLYAQLLKASGVDTVITVHNHSRKVQSLFSSIFGGDFHNLIPAEVYAHYVRNSDFVETGVNGENLILCAPDKGARPFLDLVWESLQLPECRRITMDKTRVRERRVTMEVSGNSDCGIADLEGRDVIMLDDMVRTGTTIVECSRRLCVGNPRRVAFCVTHFQPSQEARESLNYKKLDEILTTATIPGILNRDCQGRLRGKMAVLKIGKWICRYVLALLGEDGGRFRDDFYSVDISSKNPRWSSAYAAQITEDRPVTC